MAMSLWGLRSGRDRRETVDKKNFGMRGNNDYIGLNYLPSPNILKTLLPTIPQLPGKGTGRRETNKGLIPFPLQFTPTWNPESLLPRQKKKKNSKNKTTAHDVAGGG